VEAAALETALDADEPKAALVALVLSRLRASMMTSPSRRELGLSSSSSSSSDSDSSGARQQQRQLQPGAQGGSEPVQPRTAARRKKKSHHGGADSMTSNSSTRQARSQAPASAASAAAAAAASSQQQVAVDRSISEAVPPVSVRASQGSSSQGPSSGARAGHSHSPGGGVHAARGGGSTRLVSAGREASRDEAPRLFATGKHAMLSYEWGEQAKIKRVAKALMARDIVTWMDINGGMSTGKELFQSASEISVFANLIR
jgi:hypothetical protein